MKLFKLLCCGFAVGISHPGAVSGQRLRLTEPATDSTFPMAACADPRNPPTGRVEATGVVGYRLAPDGRPDTASIGVTEIEFMSVAGFRSAVARHLSSCRMTLPFGYQGDTIPVLQEVSLRETGFGPSPARRLDSLPTGMAVEPVSLPTESFPMPLDDIRVEERPWEKMGCRPQGLDRPTGERYRTREAAMRAGAEWSRRNAGTVVLLVTVDVDGTVVPGSDSLVSSDNPVSANAMIASMMQCRYQPARIGGVPVPARALARMTLLAAEP